MVVQCNKRLSLFCRGIKSHLVTYRHFCPLFLFIFWSAACILLCLLPFWRLFHIEFSIFGNSTWNCCQWRWPFHSSCITTTTINSGRTVHTRALTLFWTFFFAKNGSNSKFIGWFLVLLLLVWPLLIFPLQHHGNDLLTSSRCTWTKCAMCRLWCISAVTVVLISLPPVLNSYTKKKCIKKHW